MTAAGGEPERRSTQADVNMAPSSSEKRRRTRTWPARALAIALFLAAAAAIAWAVTALLQRAAPGAALVALFTVAAVLVAAAAGFAAGFLLRGAAARSRSPVDHNEAPTAEIKLPTIARSPELLSYILDSMEGGLMTVSSAGTLTSFNTVAQKTLGYEAGDVVGEHVSTVFADVPANHAINDMVRAALVQGETFSSVEVNAARADGRVVPLGVTISPLRGEGGLPRGIVMTFKDLAQLKVIREQVQRTDQLASLGGLAAGMAHEIRNPLGSLHGLVELIQEDLGPDDPKRQYTGKILRTIDQLNTLVENLLEFSQPPVERLEPCDLRDIAREAVQLCAFEHRARDLVLREDYGREPAPVAADRETLTRALVNIVRNAFEAAPPAGSVSVSVTRRPRAHLPEPEASACIANTGSYIRPEDRNKVFVPFYTTKSRGTGLGLPIAHQIITAHAGRIEIQSDPDSGTTFTVFLPPPAPAVPNAVPEQAGEAAHD